MRYLHLFLSFLLAQSIFAQAGLPVIKATSKSVAINDGGFLDKNAWTLSPKIRPDIFTADRTRKTKWVTFYTDIDSIKVKVRPGTRYNFVVLLNGKDSCYTQIASAIPPESLARNSDVRTDTIPFSLSSYNAIQVKGIINDTAAVNLHFDISAFGFHLTREVIQKRGLIKVLKLQMGSRVWTNPPVMPTGLTAREMDGRIGWDVFEGKIVEIDYDQHLLMIRPKLPKSLKGYVRSKMRFIRSYVVVRGSFEKEGHEYTGDFLLDTGADQAIILDSSWACKQNFATNLPVIRSSVLKDPRGTKYEIKTVRSPLLKLNGFALTNIPTSIFESKNPVGFEVNYLGNDLLKRFNMILDFRKDNFYLKPNALMNLKYKDIS